MIYYSEKTLNELFQDSSFQDEYEFYKQDNNEIQNLIQFLDSIELNKKYFRLSMNKSGYKKKFRNKNISEDTIAIKEINSLLNKLTDKNYESIYNKIKQKLENKDYLMKLIIDNVVDKCIVHTPYICIYLTLIQNLYLNVLNLNNSIENSIESIYNKIQNQDINKEQSEYLQFCDKNKKLDQLIGHSLLITECEKLKIISNKIHPSLKELLYLLETNEDSNEKYKCVQCLYSIFQSLYQDCLLPEGYIQIITKLKDKESSMKIKFKLMDILDRK